MSRLIATISAIWILLIAISCTWNIVSSAEANRDLAVETSRRLFEQIVITRAWNAGHGGVYVPVTEDTQPNEYLDDPMREIIIDENLTLTKINPAFMTRQVSEASSETQGVRFRITSLNPIRPDNKPTDLEAEALHEFDRGVGEFHRTLGGGKEREFFYMAPLITEASCLPCHAQQGYVVGNIRGGISVIQPLPVDSQAATIIVLFSVVGVIGLSGILYFGSRMNKAYKIIAAHAMIDGLTGIANRRSLTEALHREFSRSRRETTPLSVIMCDVDFFKEYNDSFGHQAGDSCLKSIADILADEAHRSTDFCARYGGEEFVVVLPNTDGDGAYIKAEAIRERVEALRISDRNQSSRVTVSCGVSTTTGLTDVVETGEALLSLADDALYIAKERGRNLVEMSQS